MNKRQKEKLFECINLEDGFKDVLYDITNELDEKYEKICAAERVEIDNIKRKYNKQKEMRFSREKRISSELKAYLRAVEKYSTFKISMSDNDDIMGILIDIVSLYKGEQYECNFITDPKTKEVSLIINPETMDVLDNMEIDDLIDDDTILDFTYELNYGNEEVTFYNLRNASIATESLSTNPCETSYLNISDNSLDHEYILEFINLVVKYRMEKQSDDISFIELKRLEQAFICSKQTEIEALNRKRSQEEREELEKRIEERDALLDKYIEDNFDIIDELPSEVALGNVSSPKVLKKLIEANNETNNE